MRLWGKEMNKEATGFFDGLLQRPLRVNFFILIAGAVLLVIYCLIHAASPSYVINIFGLSVGGYFLHAFAILAKELGFAALVAVTLNLSIEAFNRRRHDTEKQELLSSFHAAQDEQRDKLISDTADQHREHIKDLNERIFQVVYERNIPEVIFREVESQLLKCKFIRCESSYCFSIEKINDQFVKMHVRHVYSVQNISPTSEIYDLTIGFDVIKSMADSFKIIKIKNGQNVALMVNPTIKEKNSIHEWWSASLSQEAEPNALVQCEIEFERVSPIKGKEVICTMLPSKHLKLEVIDRLKAFSVRAMALHPRSELDFSSSSDKVRYQWQIDGALFPGQGMLFDWAPNADPAEEGDEQVVAAILTTAELTGTLSPEAP